MPEAATKLLALARSLVLEHSDHMAQAIIEDCCRSLVNAEEARLVIFAPGRSGARSDGGADPQEGAEPCAGLTGFLVRTGRPFQVALAARDARYHLATDAPLGPAEARLLLAPVRGSDGSVAAALVAARHAGVQSPPFSEPEVRTLSLVAQQVAAHLSRVRLASRRGAESAATGSADRAPIEHRRTPFRQEALEHFRAPNRGGLLSLSPRWTRPAYYLLLATALLAAVATWVVTVPERAGGPAILAAAEATAGGTEGRPGREPRITVQALLPGRYRSRLAPGMELIFTADRSPDVHHRLTIAAVGDELLGPAEVQRLLGERAAATAPVSSPAIRVEAPVPAGTGTAGGHRRGEIDDLWGRAEVMIGEERLLWRLLPGFRRAERREHGS